MKAGYYPYFSRLRKQVWRWSRPTGDRGSNNYQGLTTHPECKQRRLEAINRLGRAEQVPLFERNDEMHYQLEEELEFGEGAALVFHRDADNPRSARQGG
jgi:7-keto-8-aminopelargonate synthetase-like enzyme